MGSSVAGRAKSLARTATTTAPKVRLRKKKALRHALQPEVPVPCPKFLTDAIGQFIISEGYFPSLLFRPRCPTPSVTSSDDIYLYHLKTVVDQHFLDIAARITPLEVDTKVANALLGVVTAAALARKSRRLHLGAAGLQGGRQCADCLRPAVCRRRFLVDSKIAAALLGAVTTAALDAALLGKADASALASLLSTVDGLDTPLEVDTKIANALLGLATEAFVSRGPRPTRRCWPRTPRTPRSQPARPRSRAPSPPCRQRRSC